MTVTLLSPSNQGTRPLAYIALDDRDLQARVVGILEDAGWVAIVEPSGFHLLSAISDIIDGSRPCSRPALIVMDAFARGCAGTTIALGLRDLGITIPIVLVRSPSQPAPASKDRLVHVVEPHQVERTLRGLAPLARPSPPQTSGRTSPSTSSSPAA